MCDRETKQRDEVRKRLSDIDLYTAICALRCSASTYRDFAKQCRDASKTPQEPFRRVASQCEKQACDCERIASTIEESAEG